MKIRGLAIILLFIPLASGYAQNKTVAEIDSLIAAPNYEEALIKVSTKLTFDSPLEKTIIQPRLCIRKF